MRPGKSVLLRDKVSYHLDDEVLKIADLTQSLRSLALKLVIIFLKLKIVVLECLVLLGDL